jgi:hypothetical protein
MDYTFSSLQLRDEFEKNIFFYSFHNYFSIEKGDMACLHAVRICH